MSCKMVVHLISPMGILATKNQVTGSRITHRRPDRLSSVGKRYPRNTRTAPQLVSLVHAIVHVQDELRCGPRDPLAMRHVVERPLQLGMLGDILADFVQVLAGGFQALLELSFRLYLGLAERHLHA